MPRVPDRTPGPGWIRVGSLASVRDRGIVYVASAHAYVAADPPSPPIALYARSSQMGERVRNCSLSG